MDYATDFQAAKIFSIGMGLDVPNWPESPKRQIPRALRKTKVARDPGLAYIGMIVLWREKKEDPR